MNYTAKSPAKNIGEPISPYFGGLVNLWRLPETLRLTLGQIGSLCA
jgi:hypothetical protein